MTASSSRRFIGPEGLAGTGLLESWFFICYPGDVSVRGTIEGDVGGMARGGKLAADFGTR